MANLTLSANLDSLLASADYATARTNLGLTALSTTTPGTGVATALAVNVGSAGCFVVLNGALGTPSSGTLTSCTGLPISTGVSGLGTGIPTFLATPSGANLATALTTALPSSKGGTGVTSLAALAGALSLGSGDDATFGTVTATSATLTGSTTLLLGTAGSAVGSVGFRNATSGTITIAPPTGALGTVTLTIPAATDTLVGRATTDTLTNKTLISPTLTNPALETPASGVLTNCTGLPTAGLVDDSVTLAKIANAAANSKLVGSGSAGSGANYVEITLGTNLSMSGTTLNATGGAGGGISGPGTTTDTAIVLWDSTDGTVVQDSPITVDPVTGDMTGVGDITGTGLAVTTFSIGGVAVTSTSAELNILDGATLSTTELNFVDGVTSAIQTQLNAKANLAGGNTFTGTQVFPSGQALIAPALGTPTSGVLTNCTGLPASSLTAGTLAANVTLGESAGQIILDAALSADGTWSGIMEAGTAGATLAFGDLVYLQTSDSRWELADADADSTSGAVKLGICVLAAAADGSATNILLFGKIRADAAFPTMTIGVPVYVSTTAGDIQVAQPSGTDDVVRIVGYANTADELFFNPSGSYLTHT